METDEGINEKSGNKRGVHSTQPSSKEVEERVNPHRRGQREGDDEERMATTTTQSMDYCYMIDEGNFHTKTEK